MKSTTASPSDVLLNKNNQVVIKAYKKRWFILLIYIYYAAFGSFQFIEYSIITNIVARYYNVSVIAVEWTSIIYMALYPPLVIPSAFLISKKGLRAAALIGCLGTALGTGVKVFSIGRDLFPVVLLGQIILSASQLLILCLPPKIASVWFKPNEVSTACALGIFGQQLGCAMGFLIPPMIVRNHENMDDVASELRTLCCSLTISLIPAIALVVFCFPERPPLPPSSIQANERDNLDKCTMSTFLHSIGKLFTNSAFNIHLVAYGINNAVFSALGTLLNQFITQTFPNAEEDAGRIGLLMILSGMAGTVIFGIILDKTHRYKEMCIFIYVMSALGVSSIIYGLEQESLLLIYISVSVSGFFTIAYLAVGFEMGIELTYPVPESTTTNILMVFVQIFGVANTLLASEININCGCRWALASQVGFLIVGTMITVLVPNELRRQEAFKGRELH